MGQIRRAKEKDIPRILELLVQVNMVHHRGRPDLFRGPATKFSKEELQELLRDPERPVFVWANEEDEADGYALCLMRETKSDPILVRHRTLHIDDLCVDETLRGRHIGQALYRHVLDYAKEAGCYNVTLNVWECNPGARRFYENCGMKPQKTCMETIL